MLNPIPMLNLSSLLNKKGKMVVLKRILAWVGCCKALNLNGWLICIVPRAAGWGGPNFDSLSIQFKRVLRRQPDTLDHSGVSCVGIVQVSLNFTESDWHPSKRQSWQDDWERGPRI